MLPVRKTVSKKTAWGTQEQNFWIKITASRLSYELELGLHGGKKFNGNFGIWKMDIVKMTYFTHLVKLKILWE